MSKFVTTSPADEPIIVMTRTLNAPRALVWEAWTNPKHVEKWWGPHKYKVVVLTFDFRPGGAWRIEHRGPDGEVYTFKGTYREIVEPEKIVNTFGVEGMFDGKEGLESHFFEEVDGRTHYKAVSRFDTFEERDGLIASGMEVGANESFDRLEELLAELRKT